MSINLRVVAFGIVSGLFWSLIVCHPDAFFSSIDTGALFLLAIGIATGIAVSIALRGPLARYGLLCSFALGLLTLPFGAFIFGFIMGLGDVIWRVAGARGADWGNCAEPFAFGFYGALVSVGSMYYLLPISILTTFLLRVVIRLGKRRERAV